MYAVEGMSREEWLFRGLAVAMILAMVGMAVMPMAVGDIGLVYYYYYNNQKKGDKMITHGAAATGTGWIAYQVGRSIMTYAIEEAIEYETLLYYTGAALACVGVGLIVVGVGLVA